MRKPLTSTGGKEGWLYVYWNESNFGYRKIGFTTKVVAVRLRAWEGQCRHSAVRVCQQGMQEQQQQQQEPILQSPEDNQNKEVKKEGKEDEEEIKTPHIRRLEALVHATFKESRYCEPICTACKKRHVEWFDVRDDEKIKRVIAFWKEWIRREPYEFVDGDVSGDGDGDVESCGGKGKQNKGKGKKEKEKEKGEWKLKASFEEEVEETCRRLQAELAIKKEDERPRPGQHRMSSSGQQRRSARLRSVGSRRSSSRRISV